MMKPRTHVVGLSIGLLVCELVHFCIPLDRGIRGKFHLDNQPTKHPTHSLTQYVNPELSNKQNLELFFPFSEHVPHINKKTTKTKINAQGNSTVCCFYCSRFVVSFVYCCFKSDVFNLGLHESAP